MMFGKNRISFNIIMDIVMLITMVLVSISGFILKVVIPSRHAVRFQDATPWCAHLLGLGRYDWGNIHLWAGIVLVSLVTIHVLLHINMVSAFFNFKMSKIYITNNVVCFIFEIITNNDNSLALFMLN